MLRFCGYKSLSYIEDSLAAGILILWDSPLLPCSLGHRYMGYIVDGARCHMICLLYFDPLWISMMNSSAPKRIFFHEEWELSIFIDVYMGSYLENSRKLY